MSAETQARRPLERLMTFWRAWRHVIMLVTLVIALIVFLSLLPLETRLSLVASIFKQRSLIFTLMLFNLLVLSLLWAAGQELDINIFRLFNMRGSRPGWLDYAMLGMTQLGNGMFSLALSALFYFLGQRRLAVELILGTLTLWLAVETIKILTGRARPYLLLSGVRIIGWQERGRSFPSGHTTQVFFIASFLSRFFAVEGGMIFLLYLLAVLVAFTRIYVGAHYPRDVLAGALLGSGWGILLMLVDANFIARGI